MSQEEKVIQRANNAYSNYIEPLKDKNIKDEFESLIKAYKKLSKRVEKIIRQGDTSQSHTLKVQEKTSEKTQISCNLKSF